MVARVREGGRASQRSAVMPIEAKPFAMFVSRLALYFASSSILEIACEVGLGQHGRRKNRSQCLDPSVPS